MADESKCDCIESGNKNKPKQHGSDPHAKNCAVYSLTRPMRLISFQLDHPALTFDQSSHVEEIGKDFCREMSEKYIKGQKEHGGNLWDLSEDQLLDNAIDEAIDQVTYLLTIRRKRRAASNQANNL